MIGGLACTQMTEFPVFTLWNIPCKVAKVKQLSSWDEFQVYEKVEDIGQTRLGANWVLIEIGSGEQIVEARLTIRSGQEETGLCKNGFIHSQKEQH